MSRPGLKERVKDFYWEFAGRKIALGVGCANFGRNDVKGNVQTDLPLLMKCYEAGFRFFDTSRAYGESEVSLGAMVAEIDRKSVFLATKSSVRQSGGVKYFIRNFYESFDRLKTDYIDLFQIHDSDSYDVCMEEVIPFLTERKKEGMIGYIGFATRSLTAHNHAIVNGHVDSVLSYLDYNLVRTSALTTVELAKKHNVCFINASTLLFGLLKKEENTDWVKKSRGLGLRRAVFAQQMIELCESMNVNVIDAAIQYSLLNPDVDMTLNGIKSLSNLESTIDAVKRPLHPEQWAAIFALQNSCPDVSLADEYNYYKR